MHDLIVHSIRLCIPAGLHTCTSLGCVCAQTHGTSATVHSMLLTAKLYCDEDKPMHSALHVCPQQGQPLLHFPVKS